MRLEMLQPSGDKEWARAPWGGRQRFLTLNPALPGGTLGPSCTWG